MEHSLLRKLLFVLFKTETVSVGGSAITQSGFRIIVVSCTSTDTVVVVLAQRLMGMAPPTKSLLIQISFLCNTEAYCFSKI